MTIPRQGEQPISITETNTGYKFAVMVKSRRNVSMRNAPFGIINGYIGKRSPVTERSCVAAGDIAMKKLYRRESVYRNAHYCAD